MNNYWKLRTENIKNNVSMRQLIDHFHVSCQTEGTITQVHCPFHTHDAHASARIYNTGTMYCFYCNKVWDLVSFVRDLRGLDFSRACLYIEEAFGLKRPDVEEVYKQQETLAQFLEKSKIEKTKNMDFNKNFIRINDKLILNRKNFNLSDYSKYFNFLDNLYSSYKMDDYEDDKFLQTTLEDLYKEISKNT